MSFDWRPESKDRYFRKAEAAVKAAGFDDILQISKEQFAITKSTVKVLSLIHISEPTRPRLISYAVFCLKKK